MKLLDERCGSDDAAAVGAALARPRNLEAYDPDVDIPRLAAAVAVGIIKNHPFLDENKRTGYVVMETFLVLNGTHLNATEEEKYPIVIGVADGTLSEDEFADWLRSLIKPT